MRPDRIVPALPLGSGMLFWLLQAVGWGGFGSLMFLWGLTHLTPTLALANKLILVSLGIAATIGMRTVFGRARRDAWPAGRIVALTLTGTSVIAVVWSELHLVLFDALLAVSSSQPWTLSWIDLYPGTVLTNFLVLNAWGLGYFGQPHILVRFMGISSAKEIPQATRIAMVWVIFSLFFAVTVGLVGRVLLGDTLTGVNAETVFMVLNNEFFVSFLAGIIISAILGAIMSTSSSQLLVTASAISTADP